MSVSGLLWVAMITAVAASSVSPRIRGNSAPAAPLPPLRPASAVLLSEDFELGILPPNWAFTRTRADSDSIPGSWFVVPTDPKIAIGTGSFMAWVDWDSTQAANEWLISPILDLSAPGITDVSLDFLRVYHDPAQWAEEATLTVLASRDGGATFPDTLHRVGPQARPGRERVSIDLSHYAGHAIVRLGFQYKGQGGDSAGLDEITVRAGLPTTTRSSSWGRLRTRR